MKLLTLITVLALGVCFAGCEALKTQANSAQTTAQLSAFQTKAFDIAMAWLTKQSGLFGASRQSPEDQFLAQNKVELSASGISDMDARIGFRAAQKQQH